MPRAIGIDLGEAHAIVAAWDGRQAHVLQNRENHDATPCVVGLYKGDFIVGAVALDRLRAAPTNTIVSVRRLIGTADQAPAILGGKEYSAVHIYSQILQKLKADAELRLGHPIEFAVIIVPADFTSEQRQATREASLLAGLKVQKLLDEPIAAAIAFGVTDVEPGESKIVLVYAFGDTCDVSILDIANDTQAVLSIERSSRLRRDSFGSRIVDHIVSNVQATNRVDPSENPNFMAEARKRAELAQEELSTAMRVGVIVPGLLRDDNGLFIDVDLEVTRPTFEAMIADLVEESMRLVRAALDGAGVTSDQIAQVILVGQASTIPLVRESLSQVFGKTKVLTNTDPTRCVAYGAAILADRFRQIECACGRHNELRNTACDTCGAQFEVASEDSQIYAITGTPYGVEGLGRRFEVIIPRGTHYPTAEPFVRRFGPLSPGARLFDLPLYAGFGEMVTDNGLQGTIRVELSGPASTNLFVEVAFGLDNDGILRIKASLMEHPARLVQVFLDRGDKQHELRSKVGRRGRLWLADS